jgi:hypothetical protein
MMIVVGTASYFFVRYLYKREAEKNASLATEPTQEMQKTTTENTEETTQEDVAK